MKKAYTVEQVRQLEKLAIEREGLSASNILDGTSLHTYLPPRPRNSHKGNYGHVLVLGGDHGMGGAVIMAGEAAARTGAGLVSVIMRSEYIGAVTAIRPELMCHSAFSQEDLQPLLGKASVLVIGTGLGQGLWAHMLLDSALDTSLPMIVDADALRLLREREIRRENWILTPHPGEAAILLGCRTSDIQADRFAAVKAIADAYGGVAVLKGAGTLVHSHQGDTTICIAGNPGMATGGMGDVLGGIIGGLLAQGVPLREAANLGVWIHATAGDNVASRQGERGMLATDLMLEIVALVNENDLDATTYV